VGERDRDYMERDGEIGRERNLCACGCMCVCVCINVFRNTL